MAWFGDSISITPSSFLVQTKVPFGNALEFKRLGPKVNEESSGEISDQMTLARSSMIESILRAFEKQ